MFLDTWYLTEPISTQKYFLSDNPKHKSRLYQFFFIGSFLQANMKHGVFVKFSSRYGEYFPEFVNYFGIPVVMNKSIYMA